MRIGFIGLGIMGKPMAVNLIKAGYTLTVFARRESVLKEFSDMGVQTAHTHEEIGSVSDIVMTMLPDGSDVEDVMIKDDGVASYMKPGSLLIDMSSINPMTSRKIAAVLEQKNIRMVDAPVSGGEPKAIDGTLSFMVGGNEQTVEEIRPILMHMGSSVTRCGEIGAGNTVKLANQMIVACNIQVLAEALTMVQKAGVNPETAYQAIRGGLAGSAVMDAKAPMMLSGNMKPGFKSDLHRKDLKNAVECAHECGAVIPMTAQAMEILQWLHARRDGGLDHSAICRYYEELDRTDLAEKKQ